MHPEAPLAGTEVVAVFGFLADLTKQAGENRFVHCGVAFAALGGLVFFGQLFFLLHRRELTVFCRMVLSRAIPIIWPDMGIAAVHPSTGTTALGLS